MSWANAAFVVLVLVAVLVVPPLCDRATWRKWAQKRSQRRLERSNRRLVDEARQADFDALHRHHRTQQRLIMAGHHPDLAGPVHLPSEGPFVPGAAGGASGASHRVADGHPESVAEHDGGPALGSGQHPRDAMTMDRRRGGVFTRP